MGLLAAVLAAGAGGTASVRGLVQTLLLAVIAVVAFHFGQPREVVVHEAGYRGRRWLRRDVVVRFDSVRDLFRRFDTAGVLSAKVVTGGTLLLVGTDGERLRVPHDVKDGETLGLHIERHVVRPVRLEALRAFEEGEPLTFGALTVSAEGAAWKSRGQERRVLWADVRQVVITAEELVLKHGKRFRGGSFVVPFRKLPFPMVLMSVLEEAPVDVRYSGGLRRVE